MTWPLQPSICILIGSPSAEEKGPQTPAKPKKLNSPPSGAKPRGAKSAAKQTGGQADSNQPAEAAGVPAWKQNLLKNKDAKAVGGTGATAEDSSPSTPQMPQLKK